MTPSMTPAAVKALKLRRVFVWSAVAATSFLVAYASSATAFLIVLYVFAVLQLSRAETWRKSFYPGLLAGLLIGATHLDFFWRIFGPAAIALWLVYAVWIGLFALCCWLSLRHFGPRWTMLLAPFFWIGLEYFRSELYFLRFSWCSPAMAFGSTPWLAPFSPMGTYGIGFGLVLLCAAATFVFHRPWWKTPLILAGGMGLLFLSGRMNSPVSPPDSAHPKQLHVAGVQMEFPSEPEIFIRLNEVLRKAPEAELIVLSEYTLGDPPPATLLKWCRDHRRHLVVGGKEPAGTNFFNTAYVISPEGQIVFQQAKSVPIQFFKDGLPATQQALWDSPWGKLGLCICYDLSYSRVTDRLVRLGAEALIVPTMDMMDWGGRQHQLHARVAPLRAAEYQIPIVRVASSGISQIVRHNGRVTTSGPFPGEGAVVSGVIELTGPGRMPFDRWLGPAGVTVTAIAMAIIAVQALRLRVRSKKQKTQLAPELEAVNN